ncbi:MBL fold hydrolase [Mycolicibacterium chubuense]|uniref:Putative polyketide biosynthesis zinc-dependent hydrolase BaeB n=1 Tax=Mycolicibacterium chubuense TaxID=1800 RepID=A0A0J6WKD0_MYCCU|nr:MBL fold metallo-hydrolase [Mycolicibacterium chubuense]KMO83059.1 putative polyketide biosynthesis zinc-dependent hydrolase BaeB [Mycolicibacterium chubuense]ORA48952.1 MBL fold hydrolase [Mycolicibacterium chubuense]SPY00730.1 Zn-dependent hydrolase [Mycolicibacterium chubuense]
MTTARKPESDDVEVLVVETPSLGDRSYVVIGAADGDVIAAVIDPQRDVDRILERASAAGARITHVLETHVHNDYVSGGLALARATGAEYVVPAGDELGFGATRVADGDVVSAGPFTLRAVHTPGHTAHHTSYVLTDATGATIAVFSGGSLLFDSTGRTDLLDPEHTESLAVAQYRSVRRLAHELPSATRVYPTHGFGSFCAAGGTDRDASTIGEQRATNPALTRDERHFVDGLLANLSDHPAYYAHMGALNRAGAPAADLSAPRPVDLEDLRARIDTGEWVVDLRQRAAFAAGHLRGSVGFELSDSFLTYLGWLHRWGAPLTLVGADAGQILQARRELVRIGIDHLAGAATADVEHWRTSDTVTSYPVADFPALAALTDRGDVRVVDVRRSDEFRTAHVNGAVNVPLHDLLDRLDSLGPQQLWVHCASGYRASVAASLLDAAGQDVVLVDDSFTTAVDLGLTG